MPAPLRVLELFCGIGGCAAALGPRAQVVSAVDIHPGLLSIYRHNFSFPTSVRTIESMADSEFHAGEVDLWWMSPPCQPYTRRGRQRDAEDPRTAALLSLIERIPRLMPPALALENVPPFQASQTGRRLRDTLESCGYRRSELRLCPTELGIPNRRLRYYLIASRGEMLPRMAAGGAPRPLATFLDQDPDPQLRLPKGIAARYRRAIDIVDPTDPLACAACFTAAYGRSHIRSGSYLSTPQGLRRFSPREILRLLGFPECFQFPDDVTREQAWRHLGNSLSVLAVRHILSMLPGLA
jgi:site-specific DNA-cytosine methylase